jgi:GH18 family chitinase
MSTLGLRWLVPLALVACAPACGDTSDSNQPSPSGDDASSGGGIDSGRRPESGTSSGGGHDAGGSPDSGGSPDAGNGQEASSDDGPAGVPEGGDESPPPASTTRLVAYLPNYNGSYADWAKKIDFTKMTHINLAFADPPRCSGTCTAQDDMTFSTGDDQDIGAIVSAAHAAGVKVLVSIGGGGGDQQILQFYDAGLSQPLVKSLDSWVAAHNLDGVDLDIESPGNMGASYVTFVGALVATFRPEGKLVTAAVATWIDSSMSSSDRSNFEATIPQFDFVNVMAYSNLSNATSELTYFSKAGVPNAQLTLGVPFFGSATDSSGNETDEPEYSQILSAYPDAWQKDTVSGGSLDNGEMITYVGEATMAKETQLGKQYGGIMLWELTGDAPAPHALLTVIQNNL